MKSIKQELNKYICYQNYFKVRINVKFGNILTFQKSASAILYPAKQLAQFTPLNTAEYIHSKICVLGHFGAFQKFLVRYNTRKISARDENLVHSTCR